VVGHGGGEWRQRRCGGSAMTGRTSHMILRPTSLPPEYSSICSSKFMKIFI
jgi:hypothetical protein